MQIFHDHLHHAAAGLLQRVAQQCLGVLPVPGLHAQDRGIGLVGENVLVAQPRRAAGHVHPRTHAEAPQVGNRPGDDVDLPVQGLAAAVAGQAEAREETLLVGQRELLVHGGRNLGEDLGGGVAPLVERPHVRPVEPRFRQLVGVPESAGTRDHTVVVER